MLVCSFTYTTHTKPNTTDIKNKIAWLQMTSKRGLEISLTFSQKLFKLFEGKSALCRLFVERNAVLFTVYH